VLGFGDRQYPQFCGYAHAVHDALAARGWPALCEFGTVDRQSEPEFQAWCEGLSRALGVKLTVHYTPLLPRLTALTLASRTDYGSEPDALTVVLRFRLPRQARGWFRWTAGGLPRYEAGDLLGVVPPGGGAPRYYSLASAAEDGVLEICVRRHPDGVCSSYLTRLQPGDTIQAFIRVHEHFRPQPGCEPVVLIGAGTGIGPLVGFIRHNAPARPMHLYLGARDDGDGFLYRDELHHLVAGHRLHSLTTAFSRLSPKTYVQDRLLNDSPRLRELIAQGAQVVVCGGRRMAEGVTEAWDRILSGTPYSVHQLRAQGRYVEDVY
jgi:sulfite reductase (NADPH) flavoprotein alpha-component